MPLCLGNFGPAIFEGSDHHPKTAYFDQTAQLPDFGDNPPLTPGFRRVILLQFLTEAAVMSLTGGVIGIISRVAGSYLISALAGWPTAVSLASILLAVLFAASVGIFFGYYPARRAAALNPVEALRYE